MYSERAVLARSGGHSIMMEHSGAALEWTADRVSDYPDDIGIVPPSDGLWVWEGEVIGVWGGDYEEDDHEFEGRFRHLTVLELLKLNKGRSVLNAD